MRKNWSLRFLDSFRITGNVTVSCRETGISRRSVYDRLESDKKFAKEFEDARDEACDLLEEEAKRRAYEGVDKPVFYKGDECGAVREYSDTLLIVLLKANRPQKFRDNHKVEVSGPGGGPIPIREIIIERPVAADEDDA